MKNDSPNSAHSHLGTDRPQGRMQRWGRCTARTWSGSPCWAWAVRGSEPPRCTAHGGGRQPRRLPANLPSAPQAGSSAVSPTTVIIDYIIAGLASKLSLMASLIGDYQESDADLVRLLELYIHSSACLGRLMRDRQALASRESDAMAAAIKQVLDDLGNEVDVDL